MNKNLIFSLIISGLCHFIIFLSFTRISLSKKQINLSKNKGVEQIRARLQIYEQKEKLEKVEKEKKSIFKKKEVKKPQEKSISRVSQKKNIKVDQGNEKLLTYYLTQIRNKIAQNKFKSQMAKRLNLKGRVKLNFLIHAPNKIAEISIAESSGEDLLDRSALSSIKDTTDIPNIPKALKRKKIPVTLVILYE